MLEEYGDIRCWVDASADPTSCSMWGTPQTLYLRRKRLIVRGLSSAIEKNEMHRKNGGLAFVVHALGGLRACPYILLS
jgi:hypothetical protein